MKPQAKIDKIYLSVFEEISSKIKKWATIDISYL